MMTLLEAFEFIGEQFASQDNAYTQAGVCFALTILCREKTLSDEDMMRGKGEIPKWRKKHPELNYANYWIAPCKSDAGWTPAHNQLRAEMCREIARGLSVVLMLPDYRKELMTEEQEQKVTEKITNFLKQDISESTYKKVIASLSELPKEQNKPAESSVFGTVAVKGYTDTGCEISIDFMDYKEDGREKAIIWAEVVARKWVGPDYRQFRKVRVLDGYQKTVLELTHP